MVSETMTDELVQVWTALTLVTAISDWLVTVSKFSSNASSFPSLEPGEFFLSFVSFLFAAVDLADGV